MYTKLIIIIEDIKQLKLNKLHLSMLYKTFLREILKKKNFLNYIFKKLTLRNCKKSGNVFHTFKRGPHKNTC